MIIKEIELKNYRNYKDQRISFDKGVNLILGDNAQGKTNLIEAIYISSMGKSFRTSKDRELIKFDESESLVRVLAESDYSDIEVEIILEKKGNNSVNKNIKKNKKKLYKTSELIKSILIVVFSPDDLKIIKEEPEKRRRFLDREICQISHYYYDNYDRFRSVLKQRNTYLKEDKPVDKLLDIWDVQLARHGAVLMKVRSEYLDKINDFSKKIHSGITNGKEEIEIVYEPNISYDKDVDNLEGIIYDKIVENRDKDIERRITTKGPQRDDIGFYVNGIDMRYYGSQGQQRTSALSLKLAELMLIKEDTGEDAVLILDDVMSELDSTRQEYLIKTLTDNQLFITTADIDKTVLNRIPNATIYSVKEGNIEKVRL